MLGPFPPTPEGHRYVISFVGEFSRFSHCYFLKHKSDAPAALEALVAEYAKHGIIIQAIRTDQGGEYGGHNERMSTGGGAGKLLLNLNRGQMD